MHKYLLILFLFITSHCSFAQANLFSQSKKIDYASPKTYTLGGITIEGTKFLDHQTLINISGLSIGQSITIPGDELTGATKTLWEQGLFSDIQIRISTIQGSTVFLNMMLEERPRLSKFKFQGIKKSEIDAVREKIK